ncbi:MAG: toprim domain-containing protein, partial [Phycisphaerae bacterium]|nr:toprim domain-containing protein [Gemmatimonadaceae bacterium]
LGTALTEEQAALLVRYASEVFLLYDSDKAGLEATFRSGLELLRHGAAVRVVTLPEGDDPDTFTREKGRAGLETLLANAMDVFDRQIQILERRGYFKDISRVRTAIDLLMPTIRASKAHPLTKEMYLTRLSEVTHLDKAILSKEVDALPPGSTRSRKDQPVDDAQNGDGGPSEAPDTQDAGASSKGWGKSKRFVQLPNGKWKKADAIDRWHTSHARPVGKIREPAEDALLSAMVADRAQVEYVAHKHLPDTFEDAHYRNIFRVLLMSSSQADWNQIADQLDEEDANVLAGLLERCDGKGPEAFDVELNLRKLDARAIDRVLDQLNVELRSSSGAKAEALQIQISSWTKERNALLPMRSPRGKPKY